MTLAFKRMRRKLIHTHTHTHTHTHKSRAGWRISDKILFSFFPFLGKGQKAPSSTNLFSLQSNKPKLANQQKSATQKTKTKRAKERERKRDYVRLAREFGQRLRGKGSIIDLICGFKLS